MLLFYFLGYITFKLQKIRLSQEDVNRTTIVENERIP